MSSDFCHVLVWLAMVAIRHVFCYFSYINKCYSIARSNTQTFLVLFCCVRMQRFYYISWCETWAVHEWTLCNVNRYVFSPAVPSYSRFHFSSSVKHVNSISFSRVIRNSILFTKSWFIETKPNTSQLTKLASFNPPRKLNQLRFHFYFPIDSLSIDIVLVDLWAGHVVSCVCVCVHACVIFHLFTLLLLQSNQCFLVVWCCVWCRVSLEKCFPSALRFNADANSHSGSVPVATSIWTNRWAVSCDIS